MMASQKEIGPIEETLAKNIYTIAKNIYTVLTSFVVVLALAARKNLLKLFQIIQKSSYQHSNVKPTFQPITMKDHDHSVSPFSSTSLDEPEQDIAASNVEPTVQPITRKDPNHSVSPFSITV